jgi:hypothetical protein
MTGYHRELPDDTRFMLFGPDPKNTFYGRALCWRLLPRATRQSWTRDFSKILSRGCKGIRGEAQAKLAALEHPRDDIHKRPFLKVGGNS